MKRKSILQLLLLIGTGLVVMGSCKYDEVLPPEVAPGISFSTDVIPIFNASCNSAGCHNASGHIPILTETAAYQSLWSGGYIDTIAPDQSELYQWMIGARGIPMPPEGTIPTDNATVLQWITEGALNN